MQSELGTQFLCFAGESQTRDNPATAISQARYDAPHSLSMPNLSVSERAVLSLLLDGKPNKAIAKQLGIGLRTVELRRSNLMKKFDARSLAELVRMALQAGIDADEAPAEPTANSSYDVA